MGCDVLVVLVDETWCFVWVLLLLVNTLLIDLTIFFVNVGLGSALSSGLLCLMFSLCCLTLFGWCFD